MMFRTTTLLLGALLLGACSDSTGGNGGPAPLAPGTFEATVSGDLTASILGTAFLEGGFDAESAVGVLMSDRRVPSETKQVVVVAMDRPALGANAVGRAPTTAPFRANFMIFEGFTEEISFSATAQQGTVTVQEVTTDLVRGTFDFTGVTSVPPTRTVRVVGRFHAVRAPAS